MVDYSFSNVVILILQGYWYFIPLFISNPTATFTANSRPMDFGRSFSDGKRILGDGKSWGGLIGGTMFGLLVGLVLALVVDMAGMAHVWQWGDSSAEIIVVVFLISFGALFGDALGSFIKRRLDIGRGRKAPGLDQYDMIAGVIILLLVFRTGWFMDHFIRDGHWIGLLGVIILTPVIHRVANIIGYKIGVKQVPW